MASSSNGHPPSYGHHALVLPLTADTYEDWRYKVIMDLGDELLDLVTGVTPESNTAKWKQDNRAAIKIITATVIAPEIHLVRHLTKAADVWSTLEANYRDTSTLREVNIFETISRLKYKAGGNIHTHINEFTGLLSQVRNLKGLKSIPDSIWIGRFLRSLPEEFQSFLRPAARHRSPQRRPQRREKRGQQQTTPRAETSASATFWFCRRQQFDQFEGRKQQEEEAEGQERQGRLDIWLG